MKRCTTRMWYYRMVNKNKNDEVAGTISAKGLNYKKAWTFISSHNTNYLVLELYEVPND